jgi:hypothetical protein
VNCHYCGDEIQGVGIDRVNSNLGYSEDNCVPCCQICNEMKLDYPLSDWLKQVRKIAKHMGADQ